MAKNSPRKAKPKKHVQGILGVGLDNRDGEKRITRSEEMVIVGGSKETHEKMQETAIKLSENIERTGKKMQELPVKQVIDLLRDAHERTGR
jgi:hypothetical protein